MNPSVTNAAKALYLVNQPGLNGVTFHGPTMSPFLRDGDRLVIRSVDWKQIRAADIITYRLDGKFPTCRVCRRTTDRLFLKADNWPQFSADIGKDDVVGRVVRRERAGRVLTSDDWSWRLSALEWLVRDRYTTWCGALRNSSRAT